MTRVFHDAGRLSGVLLLVLASGSLVAQEPPPAAQPPVEPVAAPASSEAAAPAATEPAAVAPAEPVTPAPAPAATTPARVVLLPVEFSVYQQGMGSGELVADWTEAARANLGEAATSVLRERAGLQLVPMPVLGTEEQQALREHVALFKLVVSSAHSMPGGAWDARRADFDRRFGEGLRFLRERSGADYAVLIDGAQLKQSGGSIFAQIALAALGVGMPGGGTYLTASLIDLQAGEIKWFNAKMGAEVLGVTGSDIRQLDEAKVTLRKLFEPYPTIPALAPK